MKKGLTLFLLLASRAIYAQTDFRFADSTAQWNLLTNENPMWCQCVSYYTTSYSVHKDTSILGNEYQKITGGHFLRQDSSQKVFSRRNMDTTDFLIYDFSKVKGDTFSVTSPIMSGFPTFCSIDSVDSVLIAGSLRKRLFVSYNNIVGYPDEWVYGIGSLHSHFLNPGVDHTIADGEWYKLLCFSENGNQVYQAPFYNSCNEDTLYYLGVNDVINSQNISVVPNPANSGLLTVTIDNADPNFLFAICDLTGRLILQKELTEQTTRIDVSTVATGVYLYSVQTNGRAVKSGKLIIE